MSSIVESGRYMLTTKALLVADSVEWTLTRYRMSMRSGEWSADVRLVASGLWMSSHRDK